MSWLYLLIPVYGAFTVYYWTQGDSDVSPTKTKSSSSELEQFNKERERIAYVEQLQIAQKKRQQEYQLNKERERLELLQQLKLQKQQQKYEEKQQQQYEIYEQDEEEFENSSEEDEDERLFGKFKCSNCRKQWQSANAYRNTTQACKKCNVNVLPYELQKLERVEGNENKIDKEKHHIQELCGKCKKLGYNCTTRRNYNRYYPSYPSYY